MIPKGAKKTSIAIRLAMEKGGCITARELADYLGIDRISAWKTLNWLYRRGELKKKRPGLYCLPDKT